MGAVAQGLNRKQVQRLMTHLSVVQDPRIERGRMHGLYPMVVMALLAVLCGADGWIGIAHWCDARHKWLKRFLDLPHGIPSHDTFERVFAMLRPEQLAQALFSLTHELSQTRVKDPEEEDEVGPEEVLERLRVIAIDGKTLRRSFDRAASQSPLKLLAAFGTEMDVVLGQVRIEDKSNEITAIPKLLERLNVQGHTLTLDAIGCQKDLVELIVNKGADYVITLKKNQKTLRQYAERRFASALERDFHTLRGEPMLHDVHQSVDAEHGRFETRTVTTLAPSELFYQQHPEWKSIQSLVRVTLMRQMPSKTTSQTRYFISSHLPGNAALIAAAIRAHWMIENKLHWTLDTVFCEDLCRIRKGNGPEAFAILRRAALNLLRQERSLKHGTPTKRFRANCDDAYLLKLLTI